MQLEMEHYIWIHFLKIFQNILTFNIFNEILHNEYLINPKFN